MPWILNLYSDPGIINGIPSILFLLMGIDILNGVKGSGITQIILLLLFVPGLAFKLLFIGLATGFKYLSNSGLIYTLFNITYLIISLLIIIYLTLNKKAKEFFVK